MGDGDVIKKILTKSDMENLSLDVSSVSRFSRDMLQRFRGSSASQCEVLKEKDEDIELNLGLSLGGRFGVDNSCKGLARSSSIAVCSPVVIGDIDDHAKKSTPVTGLVRTSSLPVETEEEWRKRKELQTLRRLEAKRRRSEKQRNVRGDKEVGVGGGRVSSEAESGLTRFGSTFWAARRAICGGGTDVATAKLASQGSGSSSGVTDLEGKIRLGLRGSPSPTSTQPLKTHNQDVGSSSTKSQANTSKTTGSDIPASPSKKSDTSRTGGRKDGMTNAIEDMPCVFTVGDGANGRRVDGILYKYGKGEEVRIMCICCGKFHSPAEFVKHAGGTDVDHPLKHIVVNAYAASLL